MIYAFASIGIGAALGAWLRWWFGLMMNSIFPTIPLGTLTANILGGFLIGLFVAVTRNHAFISETTRLAITTGFLGGLTTFSTFSAETVYRSIAGYGRHGKIHEEHFFELASNVPLQLVFVSDRSPT